MVILCWNEFESNHQNQKAIKLSSVSPSCFHKPSSCSCTILLPKQFLLAVHRPVISCKWIASLAWWGKPWAKVLDLNYAAFYLPAEWIHQYWCMRHVEDCLRLFTSCWVLKWTLAVDHAAGEGATTFAQSTFETEKWKRRLTAVSWEKHYSSMLWGVKRLQDAQDMLFGHNQEPTCFLTWARWDPQLSCLVGTKPKKVPDADLLGWFELQTTCDAEQTVGPRPRRRGVRFPKHHGAVLEMCEAAPNGSKRFWNHAPFYTQQASVATHLKRNIVLVRIIEGFAVCCRTVRPTRVLMALLFLLAFLQNVFDVAQW